MDRGGGWLTAPGLLRRWWWWWWWRRGQRRPLLPVFRPQRHRAFVADAGIFCPPVLQFGVPGRADAAPQGVFPRRLLPLLLGGNPRLLLDVLPPQFFWRGVEEFVDLLIGAARRAVDEGLGLPDLLLGGRHRLPLLVGRGRRRLLLEPWDRRRAVVFVAGDLGAGWVRHGCGRARKEECAGEGCENNGSCLGTI